MKLGDFDFYNNHNQFFWYDKDELVATVEIKKENGIKWICGVYVSPLYRCNGIATSLLQFATLIGGERLSVSKNNTRAMTLYKNFGFDVFDEDEEFLYMRMPARAAVTEYCVEGPCNDEVLTNADRIRAMSDEELAEVIMCPCDCDLDWCGSNSSVERCLDWLRQPADMSEEGV